MRRVAVLSLVLAAALAAPSWAGSTGGTTASAGALPSSASALADATKALDWYYANAGGASADAGWRWAPYFMGTEAVLDQTGDTRYRDRLEDWAQRNAWNPTAPSSPTSNPDSRASAQVWHDLALDGLPADLGPTDRVMAADLSNPPGTYWWIDAMFMGLPLWSRWTARTGDPAYAARGQASYDFLKDDGVTTWRKGCSHTGLFDATEDLWWRDCQYVPLRDALGHKVFWGRGNGWVLAALARTLMASSPDDVGYAEHVAMLQRMSRRLAGLQGEDGMWRTSLLSPSSFPAPETSATALFTYAMAYGVRAGLLDRATYLPVVTRAWQGLRTSALTSSGFLSGCQGVGEAPAAPSTTTSIAYCVGAFALAGAEVARLSSTALATDTFSREVLLGLGRADVGGTWDQVPVPRAVSVGSGTARFSTPPGTTITTAMDGVASTSTVSTVTLSSTRPATGSTYIALLGRKLAAGSYAGRVVIAPTGRVRLQVQRSGATLATADLPGLVLAPQDRLQVEVTGSATATVRARAWRVGASAPTVWPVSVTDATPALQAPGTVGLQTYYSAGASPAGVQVLFDDLTTVGGASSS